VAAGFILLILGCTAMSIRLNWLYLIPALLCGNAFLLPAADFSLGPVYEEFTSTLTSTHRKEALGPLYYSEHQKETDAWCVPPLFYYGKDEGTESMEFDMLYPILTYDRFGAEYRFQILQLFSFAGGLSYSETNVHRFFLYPIYWQQRSAIPERNFTAFLPFYGHINNHLFRDEVKFVMLPIYVQSRKQDVVIDNYMWPFVDVRHGNGMTGWQFWPFYGHDHKELTYSTNHWGDAEPVFGYDKKFVMWPFYASATLGIGTSNIETQTVVFPLFSKTRSPLRKSTTYFWPFGYTRTVDYASKYTEWDFPWPLVEFAHGEGKETRRVWPLFCQARTAMAEDNWYLWPVYKFNRVNSGSLDRRRARILFFLYSDTVEKNTETGEAKHLVNFFPFYSSRTDLNGNKRFQALSILEPFVPNNKSIERGWAPLYSLWRSEENTETKASSQSLLWNLYRRETNPEGQKWSALFGLFQHQITGENSRWRLFYIPLDKSRRGGKS
jgi:hypothetical protein